MALLNLFFDVVSKRLVTSASKGGVFQMPDLFQEDALTIDLTVLQRTNVGDPATFAVVNIANYALLVAIGTAGNALAVQATWTKNGDNSIFSGVLALNVAGINALADGAAQIFEVRIFDGTSYYRTQVPCVIRKSVALTGA